MASLEDELASFIGKPTTGRGPSVGPDPVNLPMIRHWVDAIDDRNPVYVDEAAAARSRHGQIVAPPAMLQTWTWPRPVVQGLAERGGAPTATGHSPLSVLDDHGFTSTLATNSELEFDRYVHLGEELQAATAYESIGDQKTTARGTGYFVTWVTTYSTLDGEVVGRQRFRVFKFKPARRAQ